jgi:pilus assembly protein Flp/PilA
LNERDSARSAPEQGEVMKLVGSQDGQIASYVRARFGRTQRGAALVEYALLLALIAVVCIVALTTLGGKGSSKFVTIGNSL